LLFLCVHLQIGTAVAVIAITAINLGNVQSLQDVLKLNQKFCLASADPKNMSVCTYIYAVGAVSIVLTILIGLLQVSCSTAWAAGCLCNHMPELLQQAVACGTRCQQWSCVLCRACQQQCC
jgi:hypothetical protein